MLNEPEPSLTATVHEYLSTSCLHGQHDYCASMVGYQGEKRPAQCKFCAARCVCPCHQDRAESQTTLSPESTT